MTIKDEDEYLHLAPEGYEGLWSDNLWFSFVDREADVHGINHIHVTNKGYARFSTCLVIDGIEMPWANKVPYHDIGKFDQLSDGGRMIYEVVKPQEELRIQADNDKYGFDVTFKARFPVFDYDDCLHGNPLRHSGIYGGHYEQGLHCTGEFEVRAGPKQGRRQIDCYSHRDHSWTDRFTRGTPWEYERPNTLANTLGHFWPSVQTENFHLNAYGHMTPGARTLVNPDQHPIGGFFSDKNGSRPIQDAKCLECRLELDGRSAMSFRYQFTLPDGDVIHVKTGRKYAQSVNGLMRAENDAECTLDCYEGFFDFEVEETGERGYGVAEYSIFPPQPRWRY
ncbi:MAG: hypothetical protein HOC70_00585 [Gammaproteobacteria bacterium]|jgi:hypothetical protein|nr:hypothetical protein [Gammaproteobacteria bacterium]MBT4491710.1 hypothetical protein [Gammaproteobacteria bacterium]MBT7369470.1 hypothetical protein [Gammaproteobacteria bacterium]